ncbi:MAG: hypothetical protein IKU53_00325, partial [Firmicutes bacterium]|nr:hypothetical protein [Bacillota bacterium]
MMRGKLLAILREEKRFLDTLIQEYNNLPAGNLRKHSKGDKVYFSTIKNDKEIYITKDIDLINKLGKKKLISQSSQDCKKLESAIKQHTANSNVPPWVQEWMNTNFDKKQSHQDGL